MKKVLALSFAAILIASTFIGCKKGDNDPFSLLSRKARITGVWTLSSADYEETDTDSNGTDITKYSYDGTKMTETVDGNGEAYNYTETMTIDKDGSFVLEITYDQDYWDNTSQTMKTGTAVETIEGVWYFLKGNDQLDVKNKERVEFLVQKYKEIDASGDVYEFEISGATNTFVQILLLDRLANKEIITKFDYEYSRGSNSFTRTGTKTYVQD